MKRIGYKEPSYNFSEAYDPSLERLNSLGKLTAFCDSLYNEKKQTESGVHFEQQFTDIAMTAVRERFYHGYSMYGFSNNFMAMILSKVSVSGLSAIVIPDDILKYPYAACSQQSIVLMEMLRKKGLSTRKVGFTGKKYGHFCFEVYYNGSWHFCDPDMEPSTAVLNAYNRPDIQFLAQHKDVLLLAYAQYPAEKVLDIFPNYFYGAVDQFPAKKARLFQKVTKIFSYTVWIFFLAAFILVRRKYLRMSRSVVRHTKIQLRRIPATEMPASYYPTYSA